CVCALPTLRAEAVGRVVRSQVWLKETKEEIFSVGMNDFVTKPIEMRRLFQVLGHWRKQINSRRES
ncbi:MAG: hypothetical protein ACPH97_06660, partial [Flavobacteriales bacterium]